MLITHDAHACSQREPTPATSPGPHDYSTATQSQALWQRGDPGEPLFLHIRVLDRCAQPIEGASVQVLHANHEGFHEANKFRGVYQTSERGQVEFVTVFPGYTGGLPRHIHFIIKHPGYKQLVTRLFFNNDPSVDLAIAELAMVLEEIRLDGGLRGWTAVFEFVLATR